LCFESIGRQAAFGRIHRLYNGGFFSSNIAIDGSLIDFGSMSELSSWSPCRASDEAPPFGAEEPTIQQVAASLAFYVDKYSNGWSQADISGQLLSAFRSGFMSCSRHECLAIFGKDALISSSMADIACATLVESIARWASPGVSPVKSSEVLSGAAHGLAQLESVSNQLLAKLTMFGEPGVLAAGAMGNSIRAMLEVRPQFERSAIQSWIAGSVLPKRKEAACAAELVSEAIDFAVDTNCRGRMACATVSL
jgi:hypothetical protein